MSQKICCEMLDRVQQLGKLAKRCETIRVSERNYNTYTLKTEVEKAHRRGKIKGALAVGTIGALIIGGLISGFVVYQKR